MSGHSKWSTIKRQKGAKDAARGAVFTKLGNMIAVAARAGGDPELNFALRLAIDKAKASNMPMANIQRAIDRVNDKNAAQLQEVMYEGYGPSGVAMLIECLTDNKNRAAMEVRTAMNRNGGSLADPGSVSFLFHRKGVVVVPVHQEGREVDEDTVLEATLEAGAEDVSDLGEVFEVLSEPTDLIAVRTALQAAGVDYDSAEAEFRPDMQVELESDAAGKVLRLVDVLEDLDDVQNIYANFDIADEVMEQLQDA